MLREFQILLFYWSQVQDQELKDLCYYQVQIFKTLYYLFALLFKLASNYFLLLPSKEKRTQIEDYICLPRRIN